MPTQQTWTITGADGQTILGDAHIPDQPPRGVLLISHGFKGYKDYGFMPALAMHAAKRGLVAHRFNFSHSGMTSDIQTFARPDLFEKDTWAKQVHDLLTVSAAAAAGQLPSSTPNQARQPSSNQPMPQAWFGHSRGGVTTILAAARQALAARAGDQPRGHDGKPIPAAAPVALITAAAPDYAENLDDAARQTLRADGRIPSPSARTGQTLYVGRDWLDEIDRDPNAFNPARQIAHLDCPVLILHGQADATVPHTAAENLARAADDRAVLDIMPAVNHVFGARNPLPLDQPIPDPTQRLIDATCDFALAAMAP